MPSHHTPPTAGLQPSFVPRRCSLDRVAVLDELILGRQCICALDDELVDLPGPWHDGHCRNHASAQQQLAPIHDANLDAEIEILFGER